MQIIADANGLNIEASDVTGLASSISGDTERATANNAVLIADRNGDVHLIFCVEYRRCFYAVSKDDGKSFSKPRDITDAFEAIQDKYPWKVIATGPGHGIQLASGRLLTPFWMSTGQFENGHRPSEVATLYSDDQGKTWQVGDIAVHHQLPHFDPANNQPQAFSDPNETMAVELIDGRVLLNSRSESPEHYRVITRSPDGAHNWDTPRFDPALFDPVCMGSLVRLSKQPEYEKNRILFACPDTRNDPKRFGKVARAREQLTVYLSYDEGETWPVKKMIDPGISAYSDMAVDADGNIFMLYEREGMDGNQYEIKQLSVVKFNLQWITDGAEALRKK